MIVKILRKVEQKDLTIQLYKGQTFYTGKITHENRYDPTINGTYDIEIIFTKDKRIVYDINYLNGDYACGIDYNCNLEKEECVKALNIFNRQNKLKRLVI